MATPKDFVADLGQAIESANPVALSDAFGEVVSKRHAAAFDIVPVGDGELLGPSIVNLEFWQTDADGFTFGTPIDFARFYAAWRERNLGEPLLYADPTLATAVFDVWADATFGFMNGG